MEGEEKDITSDSSDAEEQLQKCDWKNCKKTHKKTVQYPGNGRYEKGSGYRQAWIDEGKQPWGSKSEHPSVQRLLADGTLDEANPLTYETQAHHLIPTTLLTKTTTLKENIKLIGYNCDAVENGMMLPRDEENIPLHQLQAHRGNHPEDYMAPIRNLLKVLQTQAEGFCLTDTDGTLEAQKQLIVLLNALSTKAQAKILAIRTKKGFWPVRTRALDEFDAALGEYARRQRLNSELLKSRFQTPMGGTP